MAPRQLLSSALLLLAALVGTSTIQSVQAQAGDDEDDAIVNRAWINEFHYDNIGTDQGEFIEVAAAEGTDISTYQLFLYNGFYGYLYEVDSQVPLSTFTKGRTANGVTYYYKYFPPQDCSSEPPAWCGIQNGKDGFALANFFTPTTGRVVEFISYEGSFRGKDGPATNLTSVDIGVQQLTTTPIGWSISKGGRGCKADDFSWAESNVSTIGFVNAYQTVTCQQTWINEFHYDNDQGGEGQFIEVASNVEDLDGYSVVLYNGVDGLPYDAIPLSSFTTGDSEDDVVFYYYEFPLSGGAGGGGLEVSSDSDGTAMPAGMALVGNDEQVLEFISYGGNFTAQGGAAVNMTSDDVGVTESDATPIGSSLQLTGEGCAASEFVWTAVEASQIDLGEGGDTRGSVNFDQEIVCVIPVIDVTPTEVPAGEDDLFLDEDDFLGVPEDEMIVFAAEKKTKVFIEGQDKVVHEVGQNTVVQEVGRFDLGNKKKNFAHVEGDTSGFDF